MYTELCSSASWAETAAGNRHVSYAYTHVNKYVCIFLDTCISVLYFCEHWFHGLGSMLGDDTYVSRVYHFFCMAHIYKNLYSHTQTVVLRATGRR